MATKRELADDLSVGMSEVRRVLNHYNLGQWQEYLLVRQPGETESFIVLAHPADKSDFQDRLIRFHQHEATAENLARKADD